MLFLRKEASESDNIGLHLRVAMVTTSISGRRHIVDDQGLFRREVSSIYEGRKEERDEGRKKGRENRAG